MKPNDLRVTYDLAEDLKKRVNYVYSLTEVIRQKAAENILSLRQIGLSEIGLLSLEQGIGEFKRNLPL